MAKLIGSVLGLIAVLLVCTDVSAQHCNIYAGHSYSYYPSYSYQQQYYTPPSYNYYPTQILAVPVIVPAYGVGYGHYVSQDDGTAKALKEELKSLKDQNNTLMQLLLQGKLPGGPGTQPEKQVDPVPKKTPQSAAPNGSHPGLAVANQACAKCHEATTKQRGNGLMLLTGGLPARIDQKTQKLLWKCLFKGDPVMPPSSENVHLTDEQKAQLLDLYLSE